MQEYNGWTNFPTWAVFTYISDSPAKQAYGKTITSFSGMTGIERDVALRDWIHNLNPLEGQDYEEVGVFGELLDWALNNVNWTEIEKALEE